MSHPLVNQLRFARAEFLRCIDSISAADARQRILPMNCISWMIGHLANQENFYWVVVAQGENAAPGLSDRVGFGKPASQPELDEIMTIWRQVTQVADPYLDALTSAQLQTFLHWRDKPVAESIGTMLQRNIYHYWFHTGEAHAIRQMLGHTDLPQFVGDMTTAIYQPES